MNTVASLPAKWRGMAGSCPPPRNPADESAHLTLNFCASDLEAALASPAPSAGVGVDGRKDGRAGIDRLWDSQWVNIVNAPEVLNAESTEDAVNIAVRMTEQKMAENHAALQHPAAPSVSPAVEGDARELPELLQWWWNRLPHLEPNAAKIVEELLRSIGQCRRLATAEQPGSGVSPQMHDASAMSPMMQPGSAVQGEAVAWRYSDEFSGKFGMPNWSKWLDISDYHHNKDGVRVEGMPQGMVTGVQFAYAPPAPAAEPFVDGNGVIRSGILPDAPAAEQVYHGDVPNFDLPVQPEARGVEGMLNALEEIATVAHSDQSESDLETVLAWLASIVDPLLAAAPNPVRAEQPIDWRRLAAHVASALAADGWNKGQPYKPPEAFREDVEAAVQNGLNGIGVEALTGAEQPEGKEVMKLVPVMPTEEQWGGLARDIVQWWCFERRSGSNLFKHLECTGRDIPDWLREEVPNVDHVPPKGTVAAIIYRAMLASAPAAPKRAE